MIAKNVAELIRDHVVLEVDDVRVYSPLHHVVSDGLGPPLGQALVVCRAPGAVGVTDDADVAILHVASCDRRADAGDGLVQSLLALRLQRGLVEVEQGLPRQRDSL